LDNGARGRGARGILVGAGEKARGRKRKARGRRRKVRGRRRKMREGTVTVM